MTERQNILNELENLNSTLKPGLSSGFSVPEGYFEGFAASVLAKIHANQTSIEELKDISPLLAGVSREMPYSVPENYFQQNIEGLTYLVKEDEESPVLAAIGKELPYRVPTGYFAGLENKVLEKLPRTGGRVVSMKRSSWMRIAAAAMVAGALAIAGLNYFNADEQITDNQTAAKTDTIKSQPAAQQKDEAVIADLNNFSSKELDAFISNVDVARIPETASTNGRAKKEIKEALKNIPVSEIDNFLSDLPTADEELLITD